MQHESCQKFTKNWSFIQIIEDKYSSKLLNINAIIFSSFDFQRNSRTIYAINNKESVWIIFLQEFSKCSIYALLSPLKYKCIFNSLQGYISWVYSY